MTLSQPHKLYSAELQYDYEELRKVWKKSIVACVKVRLQYFLTEENHEMV